MPASKSSTPAGVRSGPAAPPTSTSGQGSQPGTPTGSRSGPANPPISSPTNKMQRLSVGVKLPRPSGPGKRGEKLLVSINYFPINPSNTPEQIYKWAVEIRRLPAGQSHPPISARLIRRIIELLLQRLEYARGVYSNFTNTLWSFGPLTSGRGVSTIVTVDYYEREESGPRSGNEQILYQVRITSAALPLRTQPLVELFKDPSSNTVLEREDEYDEALNNIILRFPALHPRLTTAARGTKIFPLEFNFPDVAGAPAKRQALGGGLSAYRGYIRRIKIIQGGLVLAVNTTAGVMYNDNRASELISTWRASNQGSLPELSQFLKGVRVQGLFGSKRVKPILSVHHRDADNAKFRLDTHPKTGAVVNRDVTVKWWFYEAYGINVSPTCMVLNVGGAQRALFWPAELCMVLPGQSYKKFLALPEQTQSMIKFACRTPTQNSSLILGEGLQMLGVQQQQGSIGTIDGTPLRLRAAMLLVPGRRIPSPALKFRNKSTINSRETSSGQWSIANKLFLRAPLKCPKYMVMVLKRSREPPISNLKAFERQIKEEIEKHCGSSQPAVQVQNCNVLDWPDQDQLGWLRTVFKHCLSQGVEYCFIVPSARQWYHTIKLAGDTVGMQSTVSMRKKDGSVKASSQEVVNLILKWNMKSMGLNFGLAAPADFENIIGGNTMVLGLDIAHPPPGHMKGAPSIAGLVHSIDRSPGQFPGVLQLLNTDPGKESREVVPQAILRAMVLTALKRWFSRNKCLPTVLFMCRDGVSETQLQQVLDSELSGMKQAVREAYAGVSEPRIFILNTQKRHPTRFFKSPDDKRGSAFDKNSNPLPGLIVDEKAVSRNKDDWYAVSHKTLQGTCRPAHHVRLWDEVQLSKDDLEQLVHNLSFIFPRSVTSTGIPAPAKLADVLCHRGKELLHDVYYPEDPTQVYSIHDGWFKGQQDLHPNIRDTMYYI
ncbi:uncharacterized protein HMPREF1541_04040 [Cyphellophora europaea CBS 101466]|uniref:Piwi domain-containing protein n=1 Tax=Cyphellophora europaea (strain CBS 101466) TaxID=1220924 RepID=W2S036_CYPE1|nr:uncharacterized protein HMPREF1541_04040 [Cyphellophora europaea CBS 101466]ETN42101.1 hypothetical protein HMPREF1541_04040 [Cyphellophora europaea CBS 101466]